MKFLSRQMINRAIERTKEDLYALESEIGRESFLQIFDEYNERNDDCPPYDLIESLFGNPCTGNNPNYDTHCIASDYIFDVWKRYNKLYKMIEPRPQKLQTKWIRLRKKVFERDGYKCQVCGSQKNLCAHHIKPRGGYPELAYEIDNVITLCKKCHAEKHPDKSSLILGGCP